MKYVLESQVESVIYFETVGWLGMMDDPNLPRYPDAFPSIEGAVFPMYHVFADLGDLSDATILTSRSSNHYTGAVLSFRHNESATVLLANLTLEPQTVTLDINDGTYTLRRLNVETVVEAMKEPENYGSSKIERLRMNESNNRLDLLPYEYVRLQQRNN